MNKLPLGSKISGMASAIASVGFFLPWVLVSCGGEPISSMSGYQIASGEISTVYGPTDPIPGRTELFLTLGAALFVFLLFFISYIRGKTSIAQSIFITILGGIGITPIFITISQMTNEYGEGLIPMGVTPQNGFWVTVLGFAGIIIGSLFSIPDIIRDGKGTTGGDGDNHTDYDIVSRLEKLTKMLNEDILSQEEFDIVKKKVLSNTLEPSPTPSPKNEPTVQCPKCKREYKIKILVCVPCNIPLHGSITCDRCGYEEVPLKYNGEKSHCPDCGS